MNPDKPFGLFANYAYYPHGGMWDYRGDFATVEEASAFFADQTKSREDGEPWDWFQIVDLRTMTVVLAEGESCYGKAKKFEKKNLTISGESVGSPT